MIAQTTDDRCKAIESGEREFGSDFFMVDPRGGVSADSAMSHSVVAAPFRIRTEKDRQAFVNHANPLILWVASKVARYEEKKVGVV